MIRELKKTSGKIINKRKTGKIPEKEESGMCEWHLTSQRENREWKGKK